MENIISGGKGWIDIGIVMVEDGLDDDVDDDDVSQRRDGDSEGLETHMSSCICHETGDHRQP